jgi:hypothetical protein
VTRNSDTKLAPGGRLLRLGQVQAHSLPYPSGSWKWELPQALSRQYHRLTRSQTDRLRTSCRTTGRTPQR